MAAIGLEVTYAGTCRRLNWVAVVLNTCETSLLSVYGWGYLCDKKGNLLYRVITYICT